MLDLNSNINLELLTAKLIKQNGLSHTSGFSSGRAGLLILYCEVYSIQQDDELLKIIEDNISLILDEIGSPSSLLNYYPANFSIGLCGIASLIKYLGDMDFLQSGDLSFILAQFNSTIDDICSNEVDNIDLSYFHGIGGVLNYLHCLGETGKARQDLLVAQLLTLLKDRPLSDHFLNDKKEINWGIPHGLTGCLTILYEISKRNPENLELMNKLNREINGIKTTLSNQSYFRKKISEKTAYSWAHGFPMLVNLLIRFSTGKSDSITDNVISEIYCSVYFKKYISLTSRDLSIATGLAGLMLTISSTNKIKNIPKLIQIESQLKAIFLKSYDIYKLDFSADKSSFFNGSAGVALGYCSLVSGSNSAWKHYLLLN